MTTHSRREWLAASAAMAGAGALARPAGGAEPKSAGDLIGFSLNTSTISGQKLPIAREVEIASKAGYQGIEPWIRELDQHVKDGGSLNDLGKQIRDSGLAVVDCIGFFEWAVDDDARRKKALEEARRNMEMVRTIGGTRIAAPPFGGDRPGRPQPPQGRPALPGPARSRRRVRGHPAGRGLGLLQADQPAGRGRVRRDRVGPSQGVDPARRLPPP